MHMIITSMSHITLLKWALALGRVSIGPLFLLWLTCGAFWQNAQRLAAGAQVAQSLTTPVVSVATPSLLAQGLPFSAMPTAYNTGEPARSARAWGWPEFCNETESGVLWWLSDAVSSQSTSWPVPTSPPYMLWRHLVACCQPVCLHGNSSRLFPSNRSSSHSNKRSSSSSSNSAWHRSATWCKSFLCFLRQSPAGSRVMENSLTVKALRNAELLTFPGGLHVIHTMTLYASNSFLFYWTDLSPAFRHLSLPITSAWAKFTVVCWARWSSDARCSEYTV